MQNAFTQSLQSAARFIGTILAHLFGELTWRPPPWGRRTTNIIGRHRWLAATAMIAAILGAFWAYHVLNQPKSQFTAAVVRPPAITTLQPDLHPQPAVIEFARSAAPLGKVGTIVPLVMTPNLPGQWKWTTDRTLTFQPAADWPANTVYRVKLPEENLLKTIRLEKPDFEFKTSSLEVKIAQAQFYQDPVDLNKRQIVATIETNFPVATDFLRKQIATDVLGGSDLFDKNQTFELAANLHQRRFFLRSANIRLPEHPDYVRLAVRRGLLSISGQGTTDRDETAKVTVPDRYSFFHIEDIKAAIARRENGDSEQILTVATSVNTKPSDIASALQIWLLPERKDAGADTARPWKSANEISEEILRSAQRLPVTPIAEKEQFSKEHLFRCPVSNGGQVFVRIAKETPAIGGYLLADDYVQIVNLDPLPREIVIDGGLLALNGERTLSIVSRGVQSIEFEVAKVLPNQIHHLVSQTSGAFDKPEFLGDNFDERNISVISRPTQQIADEGNGTAKYTSLKLDPYLESGGKLQYGLFFIRPRAIDPVTHEGIKARTETRFVLVTDLGIVAKRNSDHSREIFVASLKNERPVAGVHISILAKNGASVFEGTTNDQGQVHAPVLDEKEVNDRESERKPVAIIAQLEDDLSFLAYERDDNSLDFSRFDIAGALMPPETSVEVFPFTDRGVYRPGDTVHFGLIVKSSSSSTGGVPLSVDLRDSDDTSVEVKQIVIDGFGETQFDLPNTASTGEYHLVVQLDDKIQESVADYYFHVEDFQPDRMKITAFAPDAAKRAWFLPSELGINVHLENLFGTSADGNKISAKQRVNPGGFSISRWKEFTFYNPSNYQANHPEYNEDQELEDVQTDEHGDARVNADLSKYSNACYRVDLNIEGFEADGGRSVHTSVGFTVSDHEFVVGYRTDSKLSFLPYQQPASIDLLAVNRSAEPIGISDAHVRLIEKRKEPVLTRQDNGTYKYEPILQETAISNEPFSLTAQARPYSLATDRVGNFRLEIVDREGKKLFAVDYSVTGSKSAAVALDHDGELRLALTSAKAAPGDTLEMTVEAPFAGYGLITIERNRVFAWKWFRADTQTSIQNIEIPKNFEGSGYVNVSFVRSLNSNDIYSAPLCYAVVPFQAISPHHKINLSLDVPKNVKPGDKLGIRIKADRDCRVIVYAVDIGILQVSDYELPNPLDWLFQKRQLEVLTHQALDSLLPEYSKLKSHSAPGGGDEHVAKNLNPFTRVTEKPVVFWSGVIHVGRQSQELFYSIPDFFDGSIRIMAVADSLDGEGSTQVDSAVHGPLIITPQAPLAAIPGDEFVATTSLTNASDGELDTDVRLETEGGLKGSGNLGQHIHLAKNGNLTLRWPIHASEPLGNAVLRFSAKLPGETVQRKRTLSIRPSTPRVTLIENGKLEGGDKEIELPQQFYPQYLTRSAALSTTPVVLAGGLTKFLENYPFDCSEQLTSTAFANLLATQPGGSAPSVTQLNASLSGYFKILAERQGSDGAFHYWTIDDSESPDWISLYVMEFFTEAKAAGIKIPMDLDRQAIAYLKTLAAKSPSSLRDAEITAKAIYLLTRRELIMTNELVNLRDQLDRQFTEEWKRSLCSVYLAASAQMLMKQRDANEWISHYRVHAESSGTELVSPLAEDAQYLTIIARYFPARLRDLQPKQLEQIFHPLLSGSFNTVSAAYSLRALKACQTVLPASKVNQQISEWINGWGPLVIDASNSAQIRSNATKLKFTVGSQSPTAAFYQITQSGFPRSITPISAGLEVRRDYLTDKDEKLGTIRVGDTIRVRIRIRSTTGSAVENVAVVDLLPSGFEVVRSESGGASVENENLSHSDIREDRVILYVSAGTAITELRYQVKVTAAGKLIVPPITAQAMYNRAVQAIGETGVLETK
jgi:alpha-2-macroglobulin